MADSYARREREDGPLFLALPKLTESLRMPLAFVRDETATRAADDTPERRESRPEP